MADIVAVISAVTALAAVISSIWIFRRQNKTAWNMSLLVAIADYLAKEQIARILNRKEEADSSSIGRIEEIMGLHRRIDLLLNPRNKEHSSLGSLLQKMTDSIDRTAPCASVVDKNIDEFRQQVIELSRTIIDR
jgi:hypothetical protein